MKYRINYGFGCADLYTPSSDWEGRFMTLASTCFGIRKNIVMCELVGMREEEPKDKYPEEHERLDFGDVYIWRKDGARKAIAPDWWADEDWQTHTCQACAYPEEGE